MSIITAGATTTAVTEKISGEDDPVVCQISAKRNTKMPENLRNMTWAVQNLFYLVPHSQMALLKGGWLDRTNGLFLSESEYHTLCTKQSIWWMKYIVIERQISPRISCEEHICINTQKCKIASYSYPDIKHLHLNLKTNNLVLNTNI